MTNNETSNISERTWARTLDPIAKAGFMDGATDGQTAEFQSSFDMGFHQGLCFGFNLGKVDALNSIRRQQDDSHPLHRDIRSVNCEICANNVTPRQNIVNLFNIQKEKNDDYLANNIIKIT